MSGKEIGLLIINQSVIPLNRYGNQYIKNIENVCEIAEQAKGRKKGVINRYYGIAQATNTLKGRLYFEFMKSQMALNSLNATAMSMATVEEAEVKFKSLTKNNPTELKDEGKVGYYLEDRSILDYKEGYKVDLVKMHMKELKSSLKIVNAINLFIDCMAEYADIEEIREIKAESDFLYGKLGAYNDTRQDIIKTINIWKELISTDEEKEQLKTKDYVINNVLVELNESDYDIEPYTKENTELILNSDNPWWYKIEMLTLLLTKY